MYHPKILAGKQGNTIYGEPPSIDDKGKLHNMEFSQRLMGGRTAFHMIEGHKALNKKNGTQEIAYEKGKLEVAKKSKAAKLVRSSIEFDDILERAHQTYNISPDPSDHLFVSTIIFTTETSNKNGIGFSAANLKEWSPMFGREYFSTWSGKPTYEEHKNDVPAEAKGIIVDSSMTDLKDWPGFSIVSLLATYDRSKDPYLFKEIKDGKSNAYSMGAIVEYYKCSVCGMERMGNEDPKCEHINMAANGLFVDQQTGRLVYEIVMNTNGLELSKVKVPAYRMAVTDQVYHLENPENLK